MLRTILLLRCLAATPGKLPSWSLHVPPRLLASSCTISFQNWLTRACPQGLHSNGFSYIRLSASDPAISSCLKAEIPRIWIISHSIQVGLRLNRDVKAQQRGCHHTICPRDTNTPTTQIPALRHTVAIFSENRSTDSKIMGRSRKNELPLKEYHALILGLVAALMTTLTDFNLRHYAHVQEMYQNLGIYQQEGAGILHTVKQNLGGAWNRLCSVFGVLAYFWVNDPDWYPGSVLSKIMPIFREVSWYAMAILLALYGIFSAYCSN